MRARSAPSSRSARPTGTRRKSMTAQLNHTIVWCHDKLRSSAFLAEMLGLPPPRSFFHFAIVDAANGVSLDFAEKEGPVAKQHYAFLVSEREFDDGMARILGKGLTFWADPARTEPGVINH